MKLSHFYSLSVLSALFSSSCGGTGNTATQTQPKTFSVMVLAPRKAEITADFPASILGIQNIEIRPKIDGYIQHIYVDEGQR